MNHHNALMQRKIGQAGHVLSALLTRHCSITAVQINEQGIVIDILPPPEKAYLTGDYTVVNGTAAGRYSQYQTRLHGATIRWNVSQLTH